jgi:hypothetical protein
VSEREDALLERVLQQVDHPGLEDPGLDLKGDERRLWREYAELAAMLPSALEPAEPPPRILDGLLAMVRDDAAVGSASAQPTPFKPPVTAIVPARRSPPTWRAVAATLAAVAIGLAGLAGWLQGERSRQRATIADLEQRLVAVSRRDQALEHAHAQLEPLRSVVTSAGMRACPLRPWGEPPQQPWARAVVYFDGDHHQSYLVARDLEPCRHGSRYVLWFLVDGKPVPGGSFQAQKGEPVALSAEEVPDATRGAFLTLEPDPAAKKPTGPPILYGEGAEEML